MYYFLLYDIVPIYYIKVQNYNLMLEIVNLIHQICKNSTCSK